MKYRNILISGASVAGPTLAYWLNRYGFTVTLVERAPALRDGGQAVDLRGTAREVADRMGILPAIRAAHTGARGLALVNETGKRVASMGADVLGDSGGAIAELEIQRGDLARILYEATRNEADYIFDDSITSITQRDDGVHVSFERGAARVFDLVIGADGLHSTVRGLAFGPESRFVRDLGCYVSIFTATTDAPLDGWEVFYSHPSGKTAGLYPMRENKAKAIFFFAAPHATFDRHDSAQQKQLLAQAFAGLGWEVPRLLDEMWRAPDFYFARGAQVQMERWSNGRVALLGDAGYCASPLAGMGTSLALVGAYVLAGELATADGDHAAAFARYERQMRVYVKKSQGQAKGASSFLLPKSSRQIWMRNQMIRSLPYMPWKSLIAGNVSRLANTVKLKDYQDIGAPTSHSMAR